MGRESGFEQFAKGQSFFHIVDSIQAQTLQNFIISCDRTVPLTSTILRDSPLAAPDPNFNQFGSSGTAPINGVSSGNSGASWANFSQQPQNTKMQWMAASNGAAANPFMVSTCVSKVSRVMF